VRWATRKGIHIDRAACAWLIHRNIDQRARFLFVTDLWRIAAIVHEADVEDDRYDAPEAPGPDAVLRGLSMIHSDDEILRLTGPVCNGLYEYCHAAMLLGHEPS
jgi:hypothetical protein